GHVNDGCPVWFHFAGLRIHPFSAVVADVGDPARALSVNDRLVRAAVLQVAITGKIHVAGARRGHLRRGGETTEHDSEDEEAVTHEASLAVSLCADPAL